MNKINDTVTPTPSVYKTKLFPDQERQNKYT